MSTEKQLLKQAWLAYQGFDRIINNSNRTQDELNKSYSKLDKVMMEIWDYMSNDIVSG